MQTVKSDGEYGSGRAHLVAAVARFQIASELCEEGDALVYVSDIKVEM